MGHLPIVNSTTYADALRDGAIRTTGKIGGTLWVKTLADMAADMLATRRGDAVFPWITARGGVRNEGFKAALKVDGPPFFDPAQRYPLGFPLDPIGTEHTPLVEDQALDLFQPRLLWNAIGKKSLGRGRSLTHQTLNEDDTLLARLGLAIRPATIGAFMPSATQIPLTINLTQNTPWTGASPTSLGGLNLAAVPWVTNGDFVYEKVLEAWVMEHIDQPAMQPFWSLLPAVAGGQLIWFGNYLPYGVAGKNIDVVALHETPTGLVATVIELKKGTLSRSVFIGAARQASAYAVFIEDAFNHYGKAVQLQAVVLSKHSRPKGGVTAAHVPITTSHQGQAITPAWLTYKIIQPGGSVQFGRLV